MSYEVLVGPRDVAEMDGKFLLRSIAPFPKMC